MNELPNNAPVFHLNLIRKWFDMIRSGEKPEEYREITAYWRKRFKKHSHIHVGSTWWPCDKVRVIFSNGYAKDRDQFEARVTGMRFNSEGKPEWGAEPGKEYFVLEVEVIGDFEKKVNIYLPFLVFK
ncbi:MAG: ASCH domain-containing protein [Roseivirga sp.]|nr:ASCH domain-containing protein [Roseivirga sp.]